MSQRFDIAPCVLTPKTTVWNIRLDGHPIATTGPEHTAERIARYFENNGVTSMDAYLALPNPVRIAFISATNQARPTFKLALA